MKQTDKNYKEKACKICGSYFKPMYPYEKYCCDECRDIGYKASKKESNKRFSIKKSAEIREYNHRHRFCPECGRPLDNGNQRVHFECMVKRWREGDRDKKIKLYFQNRGYRLCEVDELAKEGE
jgi:predicted nucleic acid-binding Zn ribbon protein